MNPVELIIVFSLVLPLAAIHFVIAGALEEKFKRKRSERQRAQIERVLNENRKALSVRPVKPPLRPTVRGYESASYCGRIL